MIEQIKACPFCAETIKAAAVVCRFCSRELAGTLTKPPVSQGNLRNCPNCGGRGQVRTDCLSCQGSGKDICQRCGGDGKMYVDNGTILGDVFRCNVCHGEGRVRCDYCNGSGNDTDTCSTCGGCGQMTVAEFDALKRKEAEAARQREVVQQKRQIEQQKRKEEENARWLADEPKRAAAAAKMKAAIETQRREEERARRHKEQQWRSEVEQARIRFNCCTHCGRRMGFLESTFKGKSKHDQCDTFQPPKGTGTKLWYCPHCRDYTLGMVGRECSEHSFGVFENRFRCGVCKNLGSKV